MVPLLLGRRPCYSSMLDAIVIRLEAIAIRSETIAIGLEAIADRFLGRCY